MERQRHPEPTVGAQRGAPVAHAACCPGAAPEWLHAPLHRGVPERREIAASADGHLRLRPWVDRRAPEPSARPAEGPAGLNCRKPGAARVLKFPPNRDVRGGSAASDRRLRATICPSMPVSVTLRKRHNMDVGPARTEATARRSLGDMLTTVSAAFASSWPDCPIANESRRPSDTDAPNLVLPLADSPCRGLLHFDAVS
jgi:hypothetical protein